ncbi:MAG: hypothetical protein HC933_16500 [Pleurocapsa sp. SU_196_0]|nr:hypothetical protein [Pleurocapsa sp. SU_196_0]
MLNVASGQAVQARTLIQTLADIAGFTGDILERTSGSPRSGSVSWQAASLERIEHTLGWSPRHDLRSSLTDLWDSVNRD